MNARLDPTNPTTRREGTDSRLAKLFGGGRQMDTIEVLYHGDLCEDILQFVQASGTARIVATRPLVIATGDEAAVLPGLLGALSHSPMEVELVRVRRRQSNVH
ncbi:MAG TPA: hypothetical protein VGL40_15225 [Bacillota bacterium]